MAEQDPATDLDPPAEPAAATGRRPVLRAELMAFLEVTALCGLALAQPLLDVIGRSPDFLLFYGADRADVLALVAVLVLVPPVVLWGLGALAGAATAVLWRGTPERRRATAARVRRAAHVATLALLCVALAVQVGKQALPLRGWPLLLLAVAAGAGLVWCYRRWAATRQLVRVAAVGPLVFSLLFVFASPASAVVLASDRAAAAGVGGGGGGTGVDRPQIVMILLDEFPLLSLLDGAGRIDAERYPNFARLAAGSTWYRNSTAVSAWTPRALPAMLTGRYPTRDVAPHYSQYPDNLFTLLREDYDLAAQESITQLCPPRDCERRTGRGGGLPTMLGESAALLGDIVSPGESRRDPTASFSEPTVDDAEQPPPTDPKFRWDTLDDNQPLRFREFLTGLAEPPGDRPTAHVLHLLMPHTPWKYLPSGVRYNAPGDLPTDGDWWPRLAHQRHLLQLGYTDKLIGETLDALRASGRYDDSLLVVTADHGVTFAKDSIGRGMGHLTLSPAEVMWVPTFVKAPGQRDGAVDDRNWQHVDLLPTVADYAGLPVPWKVDGRSARGPARSSEEKLFYDTPTARFTTTSAEGMAVITGARKGLPDLPARPDQSLVGRSVAAVGVAGEARGADGSAVRATVANASQVARADPTRARVPALIWGTVPPSVPEGAVLAVAVNGTIAAVVPVLADGTGAPRFAGLVTDLSLFRVGGGNALDLLLVEGGGTLRRLPY